MEREIKTRKVYKAENGFDRVIFFTRFHSTVKFPRFRSTTIPTWCGVELWLVMFPISDILLIDQTNERALVMEMRNFFTPDFSIPQHYNSSIKPHSIFM